MKFRILSVVYFLSGALFIFPAFRPGFPGDLLTKSLIMPLLAAVLFSADGKPAGREMVLLIGALFFSWLGDLALEISFRPELMFIVGLAFFLFAHLFYIALFTLAPGKSLPPRRLVPMIIPVVLYGAMLMAVIYGNLGEMKLPVTVYSAVILVMLASAVARAGRCGRLSYFSVLAGAILFVFSDSLIALNRFGHPFPYASQVIMSLYVAGQYMIVYGMTRGDNGRT